MQVGTQVFVAKMNREGRNRAERNAAFPMPAVKVGKVIPWPAFLDVLRRKPEYAARIPVRFGEHSWATFHAGDVFTDRAAAVDRAMAMAAERIATLNAEIAAVGNAMTALGGNVHV